MILGHVRDNFPRVTLALPAQQGVLHIEFVVDTGFDGELTVPETVMRELDAIYVADGSVLLPGRVERSIPHHQIELDWNEEVRPTEVIVLAGRPLLGNMLLEGSQIQIDMTDGGEVVIDFA